MLLPLCTALLLAPSTSAASLEPIAMVMEASSRVQVRRLIDESRRAATSGLRLSGGDSIFVPAGSTLVLLMRNGRMERIAANTVLPSREGAPQGLARVALQARATANPAERLRPIEGASAPIAPRNGILVRADSTQLTWFRLDGATAYTVHLQVDGADAFTRHDAGTDTVWTPPAGALKPGVAYRWTVFAGGGARVATPVVFRVADDSTMQRVYAELDAVDEAVTAPGARRLLRALTWTQAGLLYDAAREFAALAMSGGPLADDVAGLYADVLLRLGRFEEAARMRPEG